MKAKVIKTGEVVDVYHEPQHGQITNIYKESVLVNGRMWTENEPDFSVKVNETPENMYIPQKIYLPYKDGKVIGLVKETGAPYKSGVDGNIEYIRTDAFVEKACEWLKENTYLYVNDYTGSLNEDKLIEDFRKNYMKGE